MGGQHEDEDEDEEKEEEEAAATGLCLCLCALCALFLVERLTTLLTLALALLVQEVDGRDKSRRDSSDNASHGRKERRVDCGGTWAWTTI